MYTLWNHLIKLIKMSIASHSQKLWWEHLNCPHLIFGNCKYVTAHEEGKLKLLMQLRLLVIDDPWNKILFLDY